MRVRLNIVTIRCNAKYSKNAQYKFNVLEYFKINVFVCLPSGPLRRWIGTLNWMFHWNDFNYKLFSLNCFKEFMTIQIVVYIFIYVMLKLNCGCRPGNEDDVRCVT